MNMSETEWEMEDVEYLGFAEVPTPPERKTAIWNVYNQHSGVVLGQVRWFGRWRRYAFYPEAGTVFDDRCLQSVADFCKRQMDGRKERRAAMALTPEG